MSHLVAWPTTFSNEQKQAVIDCSRWSLLAYSGPSSDVHVLGIKNLTTITCDCGAHCKIFETLDGTLVVSVRGVDNPEDMLCNAQPKQIQLDDNPDVLVHESFHSQFKALSMILNFRIIRHLTQGGNLICTGHSFGAGVAALFAVHYGFQFLGSVSYFGYGSPRQGNAVFGHLMQTTTSMAVIVKNQRDPVCACIPQICLPATYEHAGSPIYIGEDPSPNIPNHLYIGDHDILNYIKNIQGIPHGFCLLS